MRYLLLALLLMSCTPIPRDPPPVPYPNNWEIIYGPSWAATSNRTGRGGYSQKDLLRGLEALGDKFIRERQRRALTAKLNREEDD